MVLLVIAHFFTSATQGTAETENQPRDQAAGVPEVFRHFTQDSTAVGHHILVPIGSSAVNLLSKNSGVSSIDD